MKKWVLVLAITLLGSNALALGSVTCVDSDGNQLSLSDGIAIYGKLNIKTKLYSIEPGTYSVNLGYIKGRRIYEVMSVDLQNPGRYGIIVFEKALSWSVDQGPAYLELGESTDSLNLVCRR